VRPLSLFIAIVLLGFCSDLWPFLSIIGLFIFLLSLILHSTGLSGRHRLLLFVGNSPSFSDRAYSVNHFFPHKTPQLSKINQYILYIIEEEQ
jgi:hypothetical protein